MANDELYSVFRWKAITACTNTNAYPDSTDDGRYTFLTALRKRKLKLLDLALKSSFDISLASQLQTSK